MRWITITKTTMVVIFNLQKSHFLTLSLPTEEECQVNGQNRPVTNLPLSCQIFILSHETCQHPSHWILNSRSPFLVLVFPPTRKVWTSLSVSDTDFLVFSTPQHDKVPPNYLVLRIVTALPFIHQPGRVAPKASDVSAADWLYQHTLEKNDIFSRVLLRLFSGPEIPV